MEFSAFATWLLVGFVAKYFLLAGIIGLGSVRAASNTSSTRGPSGENGWAEEL